MEGSANGILHIFNPETDFALGCGGSNFTPNTAIRSLRRHLALMPAYWARKGDAILLLDEPTEAVPQETAEIINNKELHIIRSEDLRDLKEMGITSVKPWGWNHTLRRFLLNNNIDKQLLPDSASIEILRQKAHRRNTIEFHRIAGTAVEFWPSEFSQIEDIKEWYEKREAGYLKAPWSSSGRGVYHFTRQWNSGIENWVKGTLSRQESIMAEPDWEQDVDFATEWSINNGEARFLGYSLFNVDSNGQYTGNDTRSQEDILCHLLYYGWNTEYLELQRIALEAVIQDSYNGPVGIDCLHSPQHGFNLCVEMNLRMTMGMVTMLKNNELKINAIYED